MKFLFAGAMIAWMFLVANSYADESNVSKRSPNASYNPSVGKSQLKDPLCTKAVAEVQVDTPPSADDSGDVKKGSKKAVNLGGNGNPAPAPSKNP